MLAQKVETSVREIVYRTRGRTRGPITRLVSPSDLGEIIKPFVFLDLAVFSGREAPMAMDQLWHPHSGIATVTVVLEGLIQYAETTGKAGVVQAGRGGVDARGQWRLAYRRGRGGACEGVPAVGRPAARTGERGGCQPLREARGDPVRGPAR